MATKQRIAVPPNADVHGQDAPTVQVHEISSGAVTWIDKLKGYYKGLIALVGSVLVILNELTPVFNFLPGQDKQYVTAAIAALTAVSAFLVSNEHWVDDA